MNVLFLVFSREILQLFVWLMMIKMMAMIMMMIVVAHNFYF